MHDVILAPIRTISDLLDCPDEGFVEIRDQQVLERLAVVRRELAANVAGDALRSARVKWWYRDYSMNHTKDALRDEERQLMSMLGKPCFEAQAGYLMGCIRRLPVAIQYDLVSALANELGVDTFTEIDRPNHASWRKQFRVSQTDLSHLEALSSKSRTSLSAIVRLMIYRNLPRAHEIEHYSSRTEKLSKNIVFRATFCERRQIQMEASMRGVTPARLMRALVCEMGHDGPVPRNPNRVKAVARTEERR